MLYANAMVAFVNQQTFYYISCDNIHLNSTIGDHIEVILIDLAYCPIDVVYSRILIPLKSRTHHSFGQYESILLLCPCFLRTSYD